MDLVTRYVAAVQRELPENKRDEIGRELSANIMDQLDSLADQQGRLTEADIAAVLKQMGRPRTVAQQFVPPQPLIRLSYMPLYQYTLYMVLGILFPLQVLETTMTWLSSTDMGLVRYLFGLAGGFLNDAIFGFASITAAFWLMSRQPADHSAACNTDWQPMQLPDAGPGWQHISLQDIFTDLATYAFLLVVIWYPVWMPAEQLASLRFIVSDQAHQFLKWASLLAVLGIAASLWQLRQRFWSRQMLLGNIALNLALVIATLTLAASSPLINTEAAQWQAVFNLEQLERSAMFTLIVIAMFPLWEVGRDVIRLRNM
ncbi:MAG: hypothetical protein CMQ34_12360 [Gammaproteobacteria bacterium]|nr:hypothetical protein [Gammaproteobacteria bacterium]|tara:strand:+ start:1044 stop:1988 length:945 start_codon:yes stop_codon:yes gene_type:complete